MPTIALHNVTKCYGATGKPALDNITLSFPDHITTAIIGESGSGKSTLLQLVNGLLRPTSGTVRIFGEDIDYQYLPRLRLQIGYAVQGIGLFPHLTVEQNITLHARVVKWEARDRTVRMHELLDLTELPSSYARRYPHELSGGEQQRVGLCRALFLKPRILLLDEPFGALDAMTRSEIQKEFLRLKSLKTTTVLVTHDVREAMKLAEYMLVLHQGRAVQYGPTEEVYRNPAHEWVKTLFEAQLG